MHQRSVSLARPRSGRSGSAHSREFPFTEAVALLAIGSPALWGSKDDEKKTLMTYQQLPTTGIKLSILSFDVTSLPVKPSTARSVVRQAWESGVIHFYSTEADPVSQMKFAEVVRIHGGVREQDMVVTVQIEAKHEPPAAAPKPGEKPAPKVDVGPNDRGHSRKHIYEAVEASMARMAKRTYLDIVILNDTDQTPLEETVQAISSLIKRGKIYYWGCRNWSEERIQAARKIAEEKGLEPPKFIVRTLTATTLFTPLSDAKLDSILHCKAEDARKAMTELEAKMPDAYRQILDVAQKVTKVSNAQAHEVYIALCKIQGCAHTILADGQDINRLTEIIEDVKQLQPKDFLGRGSK
jgi:hypothetical protein